MNIRKIVNIFQIIIIIVMVFCAIVGCVPQKINATIEPSKQLTDLSKLKSNEVIVTSTKNNPKFLSSPTNSSDNPNQSTNKLIKTITPVKKEFESGDSGWIAFVDWYNIGINIITTNGKGWRTIISKEGFYFNPSWSPDGKWLTFVYTSYEQTPKTDLMIAKPDGTIIKTIYSSSKEITEPSWSSDGEKIIFTQYSFDVDSKKIENYLFVYNIYENNLTQITQKIDYVINCPIYSPDGKLIAFIHPTKGAYNNEIGIMNSDGTNPQIIWNELSGLGKIAWSPDGKQILYRSQGKCGDLYTINLNDKKVKKITNNPGRESNPTYSPDGKYIAYTATQDCKHTSEGVSDGWQIFITPIDIYDPIQITNRPKTYPFEPAWYPLEGLNLGGTFSVSEDGNDLRFRDSPSSQGNIIEKLKTGQKIKILDGPVEKDNYLWWKIQLTDTAEEGWVAENPGWFILEN